MNAWLAPLVTWIQAHPHWALAIVFVVALGESLAVVGLLVPGAAVMVAAGALIAFGAIDLWPAVLLGAAGAVVGDGISFWLGRHYRDELRTSRLFSRHPEWLGTGERFFRRHGRKSILLGRFVGPVRPFVPVVAGMLGMRPAAFYAINVLSALAWAPAYLLPGIVFGASLAVAGEVAARLAVLLVVLALLVWLVAWLIGAIYRWLSPRAADTARRLLAWSRRHPRVDRWIGAVLDPVRSEWRSLAAMAVVLMAASVVFLGVVEDVVTGDPLVRLDQSLLQIAQGLRSPWGDRIMVLVTELGDSLVIALVAGIVLAYLLWRRSWHAAAYWAGAVAFGQLATTGLKWVLQRPRPFDGLYDGLSSYAFPSGHAAMATVAYGFLAVLVARDMAPSRRRGVYAAAATLIVAIAGSRLYLGAHWLSDVLGGLSLGLAWVCVLGMAYYRHAWHAPVPRNMPLVALAAVIGASVWQVSEHYAADLQRYTPTVAVERIDAALWWQSAWQQRPAYRLDLEGQREEPLDVQWGGPLEALRATLLAQGWREPAALDAASVLRWLAPDPVLAELPILPRVHDGRHESLVMTLAAARDPAGPRGADRQLVLRLWRADAVLDTGRGTVPLWIGSLTSQRLRRMPFLSVPVTVAGYDDATFAALRRSLEAFEWRVVTRRLEADEAAGWSGAVLLLQPSR